MKESPRSDEDSGSAFPRERSRSGSLSKLPVLLFGRRISSKNVRGSREEDSSSPRSPSPQLSPVSVFSPRLSQRLEPNLREGEALFSLYAKQAIEREGYLPVGAGDLITFLYIKSSPKDSWVAMCAGRKGLILSADISVDLHAANVFLSAVNIVEKDPEWLISLLQSEDPDFYKIEDRLVPLLGARHLLRPVLERYCTLEQTNNKIPYRSDGSLACKLISALFRADARLAEFSQELITFLYGLISPDSSDQRVRERQSVEIEKLPEIVEKCISFLRSQLDKKSIPAPVIMVLNLIKKISERSPSSSIEIEKMLGAIFFLRFLFPALASESDDLRRIAKMLQMIIFSIQPDEGHVFYPISKAMEKLRTLMTQLLVDMGSLEMQWEPKQPVVEEAAKFYYLLAQKYPNRPAIQALKKECGDEKNKAEVFARIQKISQFIQDACSVHGKGMIL